MTISQGQRHGTLEVELSAEAIMPGAQRAEPPLDMNQREKQIWVDYMNAMPAGWFGKETYPSLKMLCQHIVLYERVHQRVRTLDLNNNTKEGMKEIELMIHALAMETRVIGALALSLRLTPRSRAEDKKKNESAGTNLSVRPWEATDFETDQEGQAAH